MKVFCKGKLVDNVTSCPFGALPGEDLCGIHKNKKKREEERRRELEEDKAEEEREEAKEVEIETRKREEKERKVEQEKYEREARVKANISDYAKKQLEIISKIDKNDPKNSKLFVVMFPEAVKLIDFDSNKKEDIHLNFKKITYGSAQASHWFCPNFIPEHTAFVEIRNKNKGRKEAFDQTSINGCKECYRDSQSSHDKAELEALIFQDRSDIISTITVGDETEIYVRDLLIKTGRYKSVEKIGQMGGDADIKVTHFDDSFNYIQVKTISKDRENVFKVTIGSEYPDDMLMVFVDNERTHFAVDFEGNLPSHSLWFNYNGKSDLKNIMYTDEKLFADKIHELVRFSSKVTSYSYTTMKEIKMLARLEQFCNEKGMTFERNDTNGSTVDCFINGYPVQAKYIGKNAKGNQRFRTNFSKYAGRLDGISIKKCYQRGDFEFFIVELGKSRDGTKRYKGNFCIIPEHEFADRNIFLTKTFKGKIALTISPADYWKRHWTKQYWNAIDPLLKPKLK